MIRRGDPKQMKTKANTSEHDTKTILVIFYLIVSNALDEKVPITSSNPLKMVAQVYRQSGFDSNRFLNAPLIG